MVESATDHAMIEMDFAGRVTGWSLGAKRVLSWTAAAAAIGPDGAAIWIEEDRAAGVAKRERQVADDTGSAADERWPCRATARASASATSARVTRRAGRPPAAAVVASGRE